MADQKLTYKVEADTSGAVRDLNKLGDAGEKAGKQIAEGFDAGASKSEQAIHDMISTLDKVSVEAANTVKAVGKIGDAFGDGFDQADTAKLVSSLRKAGAEFDDIEAQAEQLAQAMHRIDDVKVGNVQSGLHGLSTEVHGVSTELGHVRSESDQSRSVLANLAGNSAQDLGQLGGVVGSLGVGIGQLAEYAVDGNIALKNLAGVAGPMAALSAAGLAVQTVFANIAKQKAFDAEQVSNYADAIDEVGVGVQAVNEAITSTGELTALIPSENVFSNIFGGKDRVDLIELLDSVGVKLSDINDIIASNDPERAREFMAAYFDAGQLSNEDALNAIRGLQEQQTAYADAVAESEAKLRFFGSTAESVNDILRAQRIDENPLSVLSEGTIKFGQVSVDAAQLWGQLVDDLRDGKADMLATAMAVDSFAEATGLSKDEVIALATAQGKGVKAAEAISHATADATEASTQYADAVAQARDATAEAGAVMAGTDWQATSVQAAADAMGQFFTDTTSARDALAGVQEALDGVQAAVEAAGGSLLPDLSTPEGRATLDALEQLGTALIPDIQKAFDSSTGSVSKFNAQMTGIYQHTLAQLSDQLNISTDDAADLLAQIGLTPDNFSTQYELIGAADAQLKLQLLQTAIGLLPEHIQIRIGSQIAQGDFTGALATAQAWLAAGATIKIGADTNSAKSTVNQFRREEESTPIVIPVATYSKTGGGGGYSKTGGGQLAAAAPAAAAAGVDGEPVAAAAAAAPATVYGPTSMYAAPAPSHTAVTINVQAAVIGNRFDVDRAVTKAVRRAARLGALVTS